MEPPVQIALIGASATTVASVLAAIVSLRNGRKADANSTKLTAIHQVTNSRLTDVTNELAASRKANEALERLIARMDLDKAETAAVQKASDVKAALDTPTPKTE